MKPLHIRILERLLRIAAKIVLARQKPIIIGVTGSVGKSSAKEAIAAALSGSFRVRRNSGNFNNEIGIPLVILGADGIAHPIVRLFVVPFLLVKSFSLPRSRYPEVLVLELGIDRIGDMDYLLSFLPVSVGVLTHISSSHLKYFKTIGTVSREKGKLLLSLPRNGVAVLNADEPRVLRFRDKVKASSLSYGFGEEADVRATNIAFFRDDRGIPSGLNFKLEYQGKSIPVRLLSVIAEHHVYAALSGAAVALALKVNPLDIARGLETFRPLPGRMRLLEGVRRSLLIDDTYNASPASLRAAFQTLASFGGARKVVALGDMLELGSESELSHKEIAALVRMYGVDEVFLAGYWMRYAEESLQKDGFPREKTHYFPDPESLGRALATAIREGDIVLIKGSQGMRMEKAVEVVLADSRQAAVMLPRQSEVWRKTPFSLPIEDS